MEIEIGKLEPAEMSQEQLVAEVIRLRGLIRKPHTDDFLDAIVLEAAFQIDHWGTKHDAGKEPQDYYWLVGYLAGKALRAAIDFEKTANVRIAAQYKEKALHHCISTSAVLLNWHRRLTGDDKLFQPGTEE